MTKTVYEWGAVLRSEGKIGDEGDAEYEGFGSKVADLKAAMALVLDAKAGGGDGYVKLLRFTLEYGVIDEVYEAWFTPGAEAEERHWMDYPNWPLPEKFLAQWDRHGAGR
jgi:hypothetical protein